MYLSHKFRAPSTWAVLYCFSRHSLRERRVSEDAAWTRANVLRDIVWQAAALPATSQHWSPPSITVLWPQCAIQSLRNIDCSLFLLIMLPCFPEVGFEILKDQIF